MVTNEQKLDKSSGITVFGESSYQQAYSGYNSSFLFLTKEINYSDLSSDISSKKRIDSCWMSGNIFRANLDDGILTKTNFQDEVLESLVIDSPIAISVIQRSAPLFDENPSEGECIGIWTISGNSVVKYDNELNEKIRINNLGSPTFIISNYRTNGCYVVDELNGLYEFSEDGDLLGLNNYTSKKILEIRSDTEGSLYVLEEHEMYKYVNQNGNINLSLTYGLQSFLPYEMDACCFDIDTNNNYSFVAHGDGEDIHILKFNSFASFLGYGSFSGYYPHVLRVSQHPRSDSFYILSNNDKFGIFESSSSSSSTSSSSSSTSESSSSSSIDSSSSSSIDSSSSSSSELGTSSSSSSSSTSSSSSSSSSSTSSSSSSSIDSSSSSSSSTSSSSSSSSSSTSRSSSSSSSSTSSSSSSSSSSTSSSSSSSSSTSESSSSSSSSTSSSSSSSSSTSESSSSSSSSTSSSSSSSSSTSESSSSSSSSTSSSSSSSSSSTSSSSSSSSSSTSSSSSSSSSSTSSSSSSSSSSTSSSSSSSSSSTSSSSSSSSSSTSSSSSSSSSTSSSSSSSSSSTSSSSSSSSSTTSSSSSSSSSSTSSSSSSSSSTSSSSSSSSSSTSSSSSSSSSSTSSSSSSSSSSTSSSSSSSSSTSSSSSSTSESSSSSSSSTSESSSSSSSSSFGDYEKKSFYSDGIDDRIDTPSFTSWSNQATISFFMKWSDSIDESATFIKCTNGGAGNFVFARPSNPGAKIRFSAAIPSITTLDTNGNNINDGNWHHVLFRVNCSTGDADIYIDNNNSTIGASSTSFSGTLEHPDGVIELIGVNANFSEYIITDTFDDPTDFANFSGPNPCPIEPQVPVIIHYRAEEVNTLTTIPDQSGNGYDGQFLNSTLGSAITTDVPC